MRVNPIALFASPVLLLTLACGQTVVETPTNMPPRSAEPIQAPVVTRAAFDSAFALVAHYSGIGDRRRIVIRDAESWSALWAEIHSLSQPVAPAPTVDFDSYMIVFVSMGTRNTGGYAIRVDEVLEAEGAVYAEVAERSPGPSCMTTQALTNPVAARLVPRRDGTTFFVERTEVGSCG